MVRKIVFFLFISISVFTTQFESAAWAQAGGGAASEGRSELTGTRRQVATIIFSGLAGAILGLSTLSFYGRPQDKLNNVAVGGALGIIGGTIYTTYKSATRPYDALDVAQYSPPSMAPQIKFSWEF